MEHIIKCVQVTIFWRWEFIFRRFCRLCDHKPYIHNVSQHELTVPNNKSKTNLQLFENHLDLIKQLYVIFFFLCMK